MGGGCPLPPPHLEVGTTQSTKDLAIPSDCVKGHLNQKGCFPLIYQNFPLESVGVHPAEITVSRGKRRVAPQPQPQP